jgi:hypothetical protein
LSLRHRDTWVRLAHLQNCTYVHWRYDRVARTVRCVNAPHAREPDTDRNDVVTGEIIPPDRTDARPTHGRSAIWISAKTPGSKGFSYSATPGPLAITLALLALGILLAVILLFLLGTLLIGIVVFGVFLAALLLAGLVRGNFRRLR